MRDHYLSSGEFWAVDSQHSNIVVVGFAPLGYEAHNHVQQEGGILQPIYWPHGLAVL